MAHGRLAHVEAIGIDVSLCRGRCDFDTKLEHETNKNRTAKMLSGIRNKINASWPSSPTSTNGKTTLVDKIIHQCNVVDERKETGELILDNNDLERERGITILAKNVSATWKDVKINLIDTPGHADFGGEVERVLKMADAVLVGGGRF